MRSSGSRFGDRDDFQPDSLFIDRACIELQAPGGHDLRGVVGKMGNPSRWKNGKDSLVFDPDLSPEGGAARWQGEASERLGVYLNAGYMLLSEESSAQDAHLLGLQGGFDYEVSDAV